MTPLFNVEQTLTVHLPGSPYHGVQARVLRREHQQGIWIYWLDLEPGVCPDGIATCEQFVRAS